MYIVIRRHYTTEFLKSQVFFVFGQNNPKISPANAVVLHQIFFP